MADDDTTYWYVIQWQADDDAEWVMTPYTHVMHTESEAEVRYRERRDAHWDSLDYVFASIKTPGEARQAADEYERCQKINFRLVRYKVIPEPEVVYI